MIVTGNDVGQRPIQPSPLTVSYCPVSPPQVWLADETGVIVARTMMEEGARAFARTADAMCAGHGYRRTGTFGPMARAESGTIRQAPVRATR